ncbi:hypothetical protein [Thermococcus sp.]
MLKFCLLVLLVFVVTFPGSIAFAKWDAPYGFYKDLSVWLSSAAGGLLFVSVYALWEWRRGELRISAAILAIALLAITTIVSYWAEIALGGEMGYGSGNILLFVVGGVLGFVLSLMLLPMSLFHALTGDLYYLHDRPLVVAWLLMIVLTLLIGMVYMEERRRERLMGLESRDPSESSSGPERP